MSDIYSDLVEKLKRDLTWTIQEYDDCLSQRKSQKKGTDCSRYRKEITEIVNLILKVEQHSSNGQHADRVLSSKKRSANEASAYLGQASAISSGVGIATSAQHDGGLFTLIAYAVSAGLSFVSSLCSQIANDPPRK